MTETKELVPQEKFELITEEDVRKYVNPLLDSKEMYMFLQICKLYKLNPIKREIYAIKYDAKEKAQIVVGYETYLKRAERTGKLNGWNCALSTDALIATCTIYRKDWTEHFVWQSLMSECNKGVFCWKTMKGFMLKKVCIAQAFRLAFPDECGGLPYTQEEYDGMDINTDKTKSGIKPPETKSVESPATKSELTEQEKKDAVESGLADPEPTQPEKSIETKVICEICKKQITEQKIIDWSLKVYGRIACRLCQKGLKKI